MRAYYIYPDGTDRTLCFVGRGNLVGEEVMAHPPLRIDYVDAVTDVLLYSLDHDTLMALLLQSPAALDGLMALFMKKIELLCSWIFYAQFRQNSEKLACFLARSTLMSFAPMAASAFSTDFWQCWHIIPFTLSVIIFSSSLILLTCFAC